MEKAEQFVSDMRYEEFINDEKTVFAVIRAIEIVYGLNVRPPDTCFTDQTLQTENDRLF